MQLRHQLHAARSVHRTLAAIVACIAPPFKAPDYPADPDVACVLCAAEAKPILGLQSQAPGQGHSTIAGDFSLNLGRTRASELLLLPSGFALPGDSVAADSEAVSACATWDELRRIVSKDKGAWRVFWGSTGYAVSRIEGFSELTGRAASLLPVPNAPPTVVLSGFGMHRFARGYDPAQDTADKLRTLGRRLRGRVLDVCTGLGYTAIGAAEKDAVEEVWTIELDPMMIDIQRSNPWSAPLFDNQRIVRLLGDATEVLPALPSKHFDVVIHDPPAQALSGELYSAAMYAEIRRVLLPSGMLFHYIGDPSSKASGKLFKGVAQRLRSVGLEPKNPNRAFGLTATVVSN